MASYLDEQKKKDEDAIASGNKASDDSEADSSTDLPEDTVTSDEPSSPEVVYQPATKSSPSYVLVPLKQAAPVTSPEASLTVPTPTPESPSSPVFKTDAETGTPYVEDQGVKIPHAELATPQEKEAFKPSDVVLPKITTEGIAPASRVERGERILETPTPTPESETPVPRAAPVAVPDLSTDLPEDVSPVVGGTAQPEVRRAALAGETPKALPPEPVVRGAQVG